MKLQKNSFKASALVLSAVFSLNAFGQAGTAVRTITDIFNYGNKSGAAAQDSLHRAWVALSADKIFNDTKRLPAERFGALEATFKSAGMQMNQRALNKLSLKDKEAVLGRIDAIRKEGRFAPGSVSEKNQIEELLAEAFKGKAPAPGVVDEASIAAIANGKVDDVAHTGDAAKAVTPVSSKAVDLSAFNSATVKALAAKGLTNDQIKNLLTRLSVIEDADERARAIKVLEALDGSILKDATQQDGLINSLTTLAKITKKSSDADELKVEEAVKLFKDFHKSEEGLDGLNKVLDDSLKLFDSDPRMAYSTALERALGDYKAKGHITDDQYKSMVSCATNLIGKK